MDDRGFCLQMCPRMGTSSRRLRKHATEQNNVHDFSYTCIFGVEFFRQSVKK
jgi:hypothetical protein